MLNLTFWNMRFCQVSMGCQATFLEAFTSQYGLTYILIYIYILCQLVSVSNPCLPVIKCHSSHKTQVSTLRIGSPIFPAKTFFFSRSRACDGRSHFHRPPGPPGGSARVTKTGISPFRMNKNWDFIILFCKTKGIKGVFFRQKWSSKQHTSGCNKNGDPTKQRTGITSRNCDQQKLGR